MSADPSRELVRRRQIRITTAEQVVRLGFQLATFLGLARTLDAAQFGSAAVVLAVVSFVYMIGQLGVEAATIRERLPTQELASLASLILAVNLFLAAVLAATGLALASSTDGKSWPLCLAAAVGLPMWAAGAIPRARLLQEGKITAVAVGGVVGSAINAMSVTILTRWTNEAYVALLSTSLAVGGSAAVYYFSIDRIGWGQLRRPRASITRFISHVSAFNTINYVARNGDTIVVAIFLGAAAAGIYDRAYALTLYPLTAASQVVGRLSYLWFVEVLRQERSDPAATTARLETTTARALTLTTLLAAPPLLSLAVLAQPFVDVVFRDSMREAGGLLAILATGAVAQAWQQPTGQLLQATGETKVLYRRGGLFSALHLPALALGLLIAGVHGAAIGLAAYSWASTPLVWRMTASATGISLGRTVRQCARPIAAAFATVPVAVAVRLSADVQSPLVLGLGGASAAAVGCVSCMYLSRRAVHEDQP